MTSNENPIAVMCRLAHEHKLPYNAVLERLPRTYAEGNNLDLEAIPSVIDVPGDMRHQNTILTRTYQQIVNYQSEKKHHQSRGRFTFANLDQLLAKRVFCELFKETLQVWFVRSEGSDDKVKPNEVKSWAEFVKHLLFCHDVFAAKRGFDFADLLCVLLDNLVRLGSVCSRSQRNIEFSILMDEIYDAASQFCDHALAVVLLGTSASHEEFEKTLKQDIICVDTIRQRRSNSAPEFWATDLGLVISATLGRANHTDFEPMAALWTDSYGKVRRIDCRSLEEAVAMLDECTRKNQCAVVTGPKGECRNNRSKLTGRVFHESLGVWDRMHERVTLHLLLQHGAVEDFSASESRIANAVLALGNGNQMAPAALVDNGYDNSAPSSRTTSSASPSGLAGGSPTTTNPATSSLLDPLEKVKQRWQAGNLSYSGLADPWIVKLRRDRETEERSIGQSSRAASEILEVPMALSDVLCAFRHTLGEARHISGGGLQQSLMAIHGLRRGGKFESQLLEGMKQFLKKASSVYKDFETAWLQSFKARETIAGQTSSMQRFYYESYTQCGKLCGDIERKWNQLTAGLTEEEIGATFRDTGKAYQRLSVPVAAVQALTFSLAPTRTEPLMVD